MTGGSLSPEATAVPLTVWAPVEESLSAASVATGTCTYARWTPVANHFVLCSSALLAGSLLLRKSFEAGFEI